MFIYLVLLSLTATISLASAPPSGSAQCRQITIPVSVTALTQNIELTAPKNQSELTGFITKVTSLSSNVTADVLQGQRNLTANYKIWSLLCLPVTVSSERAITTVEFAVHGINFDHSYWNFGGKGSKYNYVDVANRAGHAVFLYDRLGVGHSSKPDGIQQVQTATQVEIAAQLIKYLKSGKSGYTFTRFIGLGHSYGSLQLLGLASKYGNLLDAIILTGFSPFQGGISTSLAAFGLTIASEQNKARFGRLSGSLPSSYLTTQSIYNDQSAFFAFPFFDFNVLKIASSTKGTATLGEFLTLSASVASNYTNPVFVVTGDKDFIFCGGDCFQKFPGASVNLVEASGVLFPAVQKFNVSIPANTGHAINVHFSAPNVYKEIQNWIASNV
ncbi:hypothetical protein JR316_0012652 [Psilocybe cubensis]|uniref:Uncharacterized protein n=1 Tax=Psilocybe cubensis TaxID=181762 RepID=A0ACB8GJH2_PSICU|nr:hypothetical protein JR316_0012652 [Psilocybe cubensis]KAH9475537.1 hypothetical protein JR316_0012652 [Psilocybe cubensis]